MTDIDYKEAYEKEKERCAYLADRLSQVEGERDVLQAKLDFIHNSAFWKMSKPFRRAIHFCMRQAARARRVLHPRDLVKKLRYKKGSGRPACSLARPASRIRRQPASRGRRLFPG